MRAAIYARTSGDKAENESVKIPLQIKLCKEHCIKKGYELLDVLTDTNLSGRWFPTRWQAQAEEEKDVLLAHFKGQKKLKYRTGFDKLLDLLPFIDVVVCIDRTRIDRSLPDSVLLVLIRREFKKHSVIIDGMQTGILDFSDRNVAMVDNLTSTTTSNAKSDESNKSRIGMKNKQDEGWLVGTPCYGYESSGKQQVREIPSEIDNIKRVFALADKGMGFVAIANKMNEEGRVTIGKERKAKLSGKQPKSTRWSRGKVVKVVDQPNYCGLAYDSKGDLIQSKVFKPIVSRDMWERIQARRKASAAKYANRVANAPKYPLAGLVICSCGYNMHRSSQVFKDVEYGYYQCDYGTKTETCKAARIPESNLVEFCSVIVPHVLASQRRHAVKIHKEIIENISAMKVKLSAVSNKIQSLLSIADEHKMLEVEFRNALTDLTEQKAAIQRDIAIERTRDIVPEHNSKPFSEMTDEEIADYIHQMHNREYIAEDFRSVFKSIVVDGNTTIFELMDGTKFEVERLRKQHRRILPIPSVSVESNGRPSFVLRYLKPLDGSGYEGMREILADTADVLIVKEGWNRPYTRGQKKADRNINVDWEEYLRKNAARKKAQPKIKRGK